MSSYEFNVTQLRDLPFGDKNIKIITEKKGGWDSRFFILDGKVVVKVPRNITVQHSIIKEKIVTDLLRKELPLPIPDMNLAEIDSIDGNKIIIVIYEMLPGIELQNIHIIGENKIKTSKSLGLFLQKLHNIPDELTKILRSRISDVNNERNETDLELLNSVLEYFEEMRNKTNVSSYIEIMRTSMGSLKQMGTKIVPCHGDFMSNNILYNEIEGKISGIIDWGDFSFRNPIYDFAGLTYEFGEEFLDSMLAAYASNTSPDFREKIVNLSRFVPFITVYFSRHMKKKIRFEEKYIKIELHESGRNQILHVR